MEPTRKGGTATKKDEKVDFTVKFSEKERLSAQGVTMEKQVYKREKNFKSIIHQKE